MAGTKTRRVKTAIRAHDTVQVISGEAGGVRSAPETETGAALRGSRGRVLSVDRETGKAVVEGVNMVYKHQRLSRDPRAPNVGRIEKEAPVDLSNVMLVCPSCDEPTRVRYRLEQSEDGKRRKMRVCRKCDADIPEHA